jgi:hypothetical protein
MVAAAPRSASLTGVLSRCALVLIGFAGPGGQSRAAPERRTWPDLGVAVFNMTDDPLGILRACLALQLTGFAVLSFLR